MFTKKEFWLSVILALVVGVGLGYFIMPKKTGIVTSDNTVTQPTNTSENNNRNRPERSEQNTNSNNGNTGITNTTEGVPQYVLDVYNYVIKNKKAMEGYVGGRVFQNREHILPAESSYQEWDVKPKVQGQNRGAERLITSDKGDGYYTSDHYRSFKKFK